MVKGIFLWRNAEGVAAAAKQKAVFYILEKT